MRFCIEDGGCEDYRLLERFHYASGRPAAPRRVLRAVRKGELAGVLVTSQPTLNGWWRWQAWGDRFAGADRSAAAGRINADLRTISRVIVDPRFRGVGLAARLVRAYLAGPDTACTEAVAAMGGVCPFFARAGMRELRRGPLQTDESLRQRLAALGVDPVRLLCGDERGRLLADSGVGPRAESALLTWARARGRAVKDREPERVAALAACRLTADVRAYTHEI